MVYMSYMEQMKINVEILDNDLKNAIDHFRSNVSGVLPGNTGILDTILIDAYGTKMPLRDLALIINISNQEVEIKPYDKQLIKDIEKTIANKNIGSIFVANSGLLFKFPPLTVSLCERLIKIVKEHYEDVKLIIKNLRRKHLDTVKTLQQTNKDFFKKQEEIVQKYVDKYNKEAEVIFEFMSNKLTFK